MSHPGIPRKGSTNRPECHFRSTGASFPVPKRQATVVAKKKGGTKKGRTKTEGRRPCGD